MTKTFKIDPQEMVRVVDSETNKTLEATGREDFDQSDYLQITGNGSDRMMTMQAKNDGVTGDNIACRFDGFATEFENIADTTISPTIGDSGKTYVNLGASGLTLVNLPQDDGDGNAVPAGIIFHFVTLTAANFRIAPGTAGALYIEDSGGYAKQTDNKYANFAAVGRRASIMSDGNGDWITFQQSGNATIEA